MQEASLLQGCSDPPGDVGMWHGLGTWGPSVPRTHPFAGQEPSVTAGSSRWDREGGPLCGSHPALLQHRC